MLDTPTEKPAYHYSLIARALAHIDAHRTEQPTLEAVAAAAGLSPAHFQRVFSQWVGVSPKRYVQYLTLDHAKALLATRHTLLETSAEAGLSGPSRLHDLFLRWEAMSPGAYAAGGAGLCLSWDWVETPFGEALVMVTDVGIAAIAFAAECGREAAFEDLASRWPAARYRREAAAVAPASDALFRGSGEAALHLIGAPFHIKVWEALLCVPSGHVTTYSDIAAAIGHPRAVRAVGTAVGRNPISWLIPCHRAIRKSGGLGGYHWGLPVKRALLAWESARREAG